MKLPDYLNKSSNLFGQNRILKFCVVVLTIGYICNLYTIRSAQMMEKIILVPSVVNSKMWVSGSKASDEYIKQFTRDAMNLFLTFNPNNVRTNFNDLLGMFSTDSYEEEKRVLYNLADRVEDTKAAGAFYISKLVNNEEKLQLEISGTKLVIINGRVIDNSQKVYLLDYRIESGKFTIDRLLEKMDYEKYKAEVANEKK